VFSIIESILMLDSGNTFLGEEGTGFLGIVLRGFLEPVDSGVGSTFCVRKEFEGGAALVGFHSRDGGGEVGGCGNS
jgi:hypothetical protein